MEAPCNRFTAAEGGARLAAVACSQNTLAVEYVQFVSTRLIYEQAYKIRGSLSDGKQRSVYVTLASRIDVVAYELTILTDLSVGKAANYQDVCDWFAELETKEVLVCTSVVLHRILQEGSVSMPNINVLIIDSCHLIYSDDNLKYIMKRYKECEEDKRPRILALTYPLFTTSIKDSADIVNTQDDEQTCEETENHVIVEEHLKNYEKQKDEEKPESEENHKSEETKKDEEIPTTDNTDVTTDNSDAKEESERVSTKEKDLKSKRKEMQSEKMAVYVNLDDFEMYEKLEWKIEELERELCCQMDLAEDIDGGKRLSGSTTKPKELIIEYGPCQRLDALPEDYQVLEKYMRDTVKDAMDFIDEHRYDPTEIYGDDLYEEFMNIPDPTIEPRSIFHQFQYVLDELGPYGADKAAFSLLTKLEKLKIKVPYERHFLLLCLCTTVFVKIRCYAESIFSKYESDWDKIRLFCTPKVLRLAEILEKFEPPEHLKEIESKMEMDIDSKDSKIDVNVSKIDNIDNKDNTDTKLVSIGGDSSMESQPYCDDNEVEFEMRIADITNEIEQVMENLKTDDSNTSIEDRSENVTDTVDAMTKNAKKNDEDENFKGKSVEISENLTKDTHTNQDKVLNNDNTEIRNQKDTLKDGNNLSIESNINQENNTKNNKTHSKTNDLLKQIDECDFITLKNTIEDRVNTIEANLKDISEICEEVINVSEENLSGKDSEGFDKEKQVKDGEGKITDVAQKQGSPWRRRGRRPARRRPAPPPHALCGLLVTNYPLMAKILFIIVVDLSRCLPRLSYLCAQYCAADSPAELRDSQKNGKKQEEVLKKFRMHECNLLLATPALEEGIDLPRCNLVVRWDVPTCYRSHVVCRGRARAPRASCVLLAKTESSDTDTLLHNIAVYKELDQIISRKCGCGIQDEPPQSEEDIADSYTKLVKSYTPNTKHTADPSEWHVIAKDHTLDKIADVHEDEGSFTDNITKHITDPNAWHKTVDKISDDNDEGYTDNNIAIEDINESDNFTNDNLSEDLTKSRNKDRSKTDKDLCIVGGKNSFIDDILFENSIETKNNDLNSKEKRIRLDNNDIKNATRKINKNIVDKLTKDLKNCQVNDLKCKDINDDCQSNGCDVNGIKISYSTGVNMKSDVTKIGEDKIESLDRCDGVKKPGDEEIASVDLNTAIALINRYCGKLPSDTFTRLAPQWWMEKVSLPVNNSSELRDAYICTLKLPLNCPVKYNIVGHPMPTRVLARRMVALQACRILHKSGELDDQLMPIGKENFKAAELENANVCTNGELLDVNDSARPGTTKRRQYYYKRTAAAFTDCQPIIDTTEEELNDPNAKPKEPPQKGVKRNTLYAIVSALWCALPERYNTRGRRLHAPQLAPQAIGIFMGRGRPHRLQVPSFPVYTRSGEVRVSVEPATRADVRLTPSRDDKIRRFMRFVFCDVLRVRRRGMKLDTEGSTHNNYYIVPTIKTIKNGEEIINIDWAFLDLIYQHTEEKSLEIEKPIVWQEEKEKEGDGKRVKKMENPLLKKGEVFVFDAEKYKEAVVTPWYRNQDQPQFFLVAEICWNLTPDSMFPSASHTTFRDYYHSKYGVTITQRDQPLLDVDHTSARLNLLTPRYVNRKGVALPVSSERTRRAKRDRLDQKQILVAELCRVHPFAAPLHTATVALPCVLYRINALLIADEIRRCVAQDVGLGIPKIDEKTGFQWPPLDFGWSLAEVLNADSEKNEKKKSEDDTGKKEDGENDKEGQSDTQSDTGDNKEGKEKTINDILQEKETESGFEIGTWSNDMASSIPETDDYDEYNQPLPPNLTLCTSASGGANWCDPIDKPKSQFNPSKAYSMADSDCSYMSSDFDTDDSDLNSMNSDEDTDASGFCSSKNSNAAMGVRIEYKTAHEAEAVDLEKEKVNPAPQLDAAAERADRAACLRYIAGAGRAPEQYIEKFHKSVEEHKQEILKKGYLINENQSIDEIMPEPFKEPEKAKTAQQEEQNDKLESVKEFGHDDKKESIDNFEHADKLQTRNKLDQTGKLESVLTDKLDTTKDFEHSDKAKATDKTKHLDLATEKIVKELFPFGSEDLLINGQVSLENIEKNKRKLLEHLKNNLSKEEIKKLNCFAMKDVDIDSPNYINEKIAHVGFDSKENYVDKLNKLNSSEAKEFMPYYKDNRGRGKEFDFDYQPNLEGHPGPSPSVILQALTMSNANDGINLERLETIGDSFLKFAITAYLYCAHPTVHEGKLSHMRSKQVSNLNLYRLGRNKRLGARMIASKFEPHDNWLPPCHKPPDTLKQGHPDEPKLNAEEPQKDSTGCFIPYNLITQHSIPDKSIADCVEALIGAYLLEMGPRGALLFMSWLGIRVLPCHLLRASHRTWPAQKKPSSKEESLSDSESPLSDEENEEETERILPGALRPVRGDDGNWYTPVFGELKAPPSPLLRYIEDPEGELERMLSGYEALERTLQYRFRDRSLLLQAMTHASHHQNTLTDCYQRLEFLGDAILDYLITRHLYEDPRRHSPGALTDLRSALVNNTIFATLAARHGFHKYFRHMSPGLNEVLTKYVRIQEENGHSISEEHYLIQEDEMEQAEDVEVPKALGDLFESVAGAIFLDSGMSLGAVWKSYVNLMGAELEAFSAAAPKSPVRELLEAEPDTAKFGKPERLADGRRVRVCVEVFGRGAFKGVGRNYRIAKGTAARCALRHLNIHRNR